MRTLVTGLSGSGKSTLVEYLKTRGIRAFDMDTIGLHVWRESSDHPRPAWIVRERSIQTIAMLSDDFVACGICTNLHRSVLCRKLDHTGKTVRHLYGSVVDAVPWDDKIFMWYNATNSAEYAARFGPTRHNDFGKDPATKDEIIHYSKSVYANRPYGFSFIDVTGCRSASDMIRRIYVQSGVNLCALDCTSDWIDEQYP